MSKSKDEWQLLSNKERTVWIAYNNYTWKAHRMCDADNDLWDPDPMIPQHIVDEFHVELHGTTLYYKEQV
jgi:hypothetical protein